MSGSRLTSSRQHEANEALFTASEDPYLSEPMKADVPRQTQMMQDLSICSSESGSLGDFPVSQGSQGGQPFPTSQGSLGGHGTRSPMDQNHAGVAAGGSSTSFFSGRSSGGVQTSTDRELGERPPSGCDRDTIKLFVGNIPPNYNEVQLLPFFETVGKVVDIVIVRDKVTRESKGSAFVWYSKRMHAEQAILQFNMRHVLPDPSGDQGRPLVLRKAKPRSGISTAGASQSGSAYSSGVSRHGDSQQVHPKSNSSPPCSQGMPAPNVNPGMLPGLGSAMPWNSGTGAGHQGMLPFSAGMLTGAGMVPGQHAADVPGMAPWSGGREQLERGLHPLSGNSQQQQMQHAEPCAVTLVLNRQQLSLVHDYMHSVKSMTNASLLTSPAEAAGIFCLVVSGSQVQVEAARKLFETVLSTGN